MMFVFSETPIFLKIGVQQRGAGRAKEMIAGGTKISRLLAQPIFTDLAVSLCLFEKKERKRSSEKKTSIFPFV